MKFCNLHLKKNEIDILKETVFKNQVKAYLTENFYFNLELNKQVYLLFPNIKKRSYKNKNV